MVSWRFSLPSSAMRLAYALFISDQYKKLRYRSALLLYAAIVVLGSVPGARADVGQYASGILLHSCAYSVLTFLVFSGSAGTPGQRALKAIATIALMGAGDEINQSFLTYRHGSIMDWLIDMNAAVLTALLCRALWPTLQRRLAS